jgi:lactate dehydrogenase-like 2-hydroxyacid dehydrogenase
LWVSAGSGSASRGSRWRSTWRSSPGRSISIPTNTVLTPHIGYVTDGTYRVFFTDVVDDIAAWLAGRPVRGLTG